MKKLVALFALAAVVVSVNAPEAMALAPFKKAFQKKYVDVINNDALTDAFKKASCNTCHVKGEKKNVRNKYGEELAKLIEGDASDRIKAAGKESREAKKAEEAAVFAELEKAFEAVAKMSPEEGGTTYGDMIKAGKLPKAPGEE